MKGGRNEKEIKQKPWLNFINNFKGQGISLPIIQRLEHGRVL